jgi:hypothetical protein
MSRQVAIKYLASTTTSIGPLQPLMEGTFTNLNPQYLYFVNGNKTFENVGLARLMTLTSAQNLAGLSFTITGTNVIGELVYETIAGPNANSVWSSNQYNTITSISWVGVCVAGSSISIGTGDGATGESANFKMQILDINRSRFQFAATVKLGAGVYSYSMIATLDNLVGGTAGANIFDLVTKTPALTAYTTSQYFGFPSSMTVAGPPIVSIGGEGASLISAFWLTAATIPSGGTINLTYAQAGE